mmetsp:Transcript_60912/g.108165  ORF Transcript_60912/g.108165 Transcript_60912/m.108165 type:complete len:215 (+) Transcript_60912:1378-2022(+)
MVLCLSCRERINILKDEITCLVKSFQSPFKTSRNASVETFTKLRDYALWSSIASALHPSVARAHEHLASVFFQNVHGHFHLIQADELALETYVFARADELTEDCFHDSGLLDPAMLPHCLLGFCCLITELLGCGLLISRHFPYVIQVRRVAHVLVPRGYAMVQEEAILLHQVLMEIRRLLSFFPCSLGHAKGLQICWPVLTAIQSPAASPGVKL